MTTPLVLKSMALIIQNGRILATRGYDKVKNQEFFRVPGGHIERDESPEQAVRREYREEFGSDLENLRFLSEIDNTFVYNGKPGHERVFLFQADLRDVTLYEKETIRFFDGRDIEAIWLPIDDVKSGKAVLYPECSFFL